MKRKLFLTGFIFALVAFFLAPHIDAQSFISSTDRPLPVSAPTSYGSSFNATHFTIINYILGFIGLISIFIPLIGLFTSKKTENKKDFNAQYIGFWERGAISLLDGTFTALGYLLLFLPGIAYSICNLVFYFQRGQTIADMILGTKIVDAKTGETADGGKLIGRFFAKFLSGAVFYIGFWMAGRKPEAQALHDALSGTRYARVQSIEKTPTNGIDISYKLWIFLLPAIIIPIIFILFALTNTFLSSGNSWN